MTEYNHQQIYKSITSQNLKNIEYLKINLQRISIYFIGDSQVWFNIRQTVL